MTTPFDLSGRAALVVGAGRGIGAAIARSLAGAGADVAVNALTAQYAQPLADAIGRDSGRRVPVYLADMTEASAVADVVGRAIADLGRIDVLVSAVGDALPAPIAAAPDGTGDAVSDEAIRRTIDLNLTSAVLCARAVGTHFLARRSGKLILVASAVAGRGGGGMTLYTAAKTGLAGFTRALALEWAPFGVQVNTIAPGYFPDRASLGEDVVRRLEDVTAREVPLRRPGQLPEVGHLAVYLASAASDYMTGQTIYLDGGLTL